MRQGIYLPPIGNFGDVHVLVELALIAEQAGWDGFFLWDHVHYDPPAPLADAWISLAAIAGATTTIRLGPLITPLPRRRPWKVAREAVTLDHLSGGRLILGVGLGIDYWREFTAFGEASTDAERAALLDDGIDIIKRLWSGAPTTLSGRRLAINAVQFLPPPVQRPGIPIWSAVIWPPARPGPLNRAARCDGVMPFTGDAMTPEQAADVYHAIREHRDDPFDLCVWGLPGRTVEYRDAGVTWCLQAAMPNAPLQQMRDLIHAGPSPA
ncbi:MAG: LLM class flavin-dependent oxidoreductase [Acidimicrobiales bacterium]